MKYLPAIPIALLTASCIDVPIVESVPESEEAGEIIDVELTMDDFEVVPVGEMDTELLEMLRDSSVQVIQADDEALAASGMMIKAGYMGKRNGRWIWTGGNRKYALAEAREWVFYVWVDPARDAQGRQHSLFTSVRHPWARYKRIDLGNLTIPLARVDALPWGVPHSNPDLTAVPHVGRIRYEYEGAHMLKFRYWCNVGHITRKSAQIRFRVKVDGVFKKINGRVHRYHPPGHRLITFDESGRYNEFVWPSFVTKDRRDREIAFQVTCLV